MLHVLIKSVTWSSSICRCSFGFSSPFQMETRKRLAKIVLVFVGFFAICWFPNHVLYMYRSFNYNEIDPSTGHMVVTLVARVLSFCNSCVNPFALYFLSESFRRHFNNQLCCRRKARRGRSASYLRNSSAIQMSSLKSNTRNTVTSMTQLNGHNLKQEMSLWFNRRDFWLWNKFELFLCRL